MLKFLYLLLITLSVPIIQVHTISFLNNLTLPNDIFTKIFFDHIKHRNLSASNSELEDSEKCILALKEIINHDPNFNVVPFIDAWGQIPSGLLYGHLKDLGNFDECVNISTNLSKPIGLTNGKYCYASIPIVDEGSIKPLSHGQKPERIAYKDLIAIVIGICVPDFCDPDFLTEVFQEATMYAFNGVFKDLVVNNCIMAEIPNYEIQDIIGIIIFSVIGLMMLLSTLYDIYTDKFDSQATNIFLAFSVITNGRKLFKISHFKSDNTIECLRGIRVISMIWIIFCHCYAMTPLLPIINLFDFIKWFKNPFTLHVILGSVSVDTFFFISGLLIAWIGLSELDKRNGKINIPLMYFHRCMRLTPALAAVIIYNVCFDKFIGIGPLKQAYKELTGNCRDNWWSTLLYIQNYSNPLDLCLPHTWYLAVDTHLYFLSPLILIPLWKWGRKFAPIMFLLSFLSIGYVIAMYFYLGINNFIGFVDDEQMILTYLPTHARYSVWLFGMGFGYFMHRTKSRSIRLSKIIQVLGWGVSFALFLAVMYGPYFAINSEHEKSVLEAAMYEPLRRVTWGVALSWLVFACHFGYGGLINSFLSHEMWQPLCRLTYCMYLVHVNVQYFNFGITKTDVYFSDYSMILAFWSTFGISILAAIVLTLSFEAPIFVIEKSLIRAPTKGMEQKTKTIPKTQSETSQ